MPHGVRRACCWGGSWEGVPAAAAAAAATSAGLTLSAVSAGVGVVGVVLAPACACKEDVHFCWCRTPVSKNFHPLLLHHVRGVFRPPCIAPWPRARSGSRAWGACLVNSVGYVCLGRRRGGAGSVSGAGSPRSARAWLPAGRCLLAGGSHGNHGRDARQVQLIRGRAGWAGNLNCPCTDAYVG